MRPRIHMAALGAWLAASTLAIGALPGRLSWTGLTPGAVHAQAAAVARPTPARPGAETALDRYVKAPDAAFRFSVVATRPGQGHTAYLLEMVSQRWLTGAEVDKPTKRKPPDRTDAGLLDIAMTTKSVVAELRMVPNQPLVFANDDGRERTEDEIIAYTWD
jgi:PhoPQ-activated pathogenicity-related protein